MRPSYLRRMTQLLALVTPLDEEGGCALANLLQHGVLGDGFAQLESVFSEFP